MTFNPQPKSGMPPKKSKKPLKRTPLKKVKKATGEKDVFEIVLERLGDIETRCFVCDEKIRLITHHNFAHILRKGRYPKARLDPNNIRIMCYKIDGTGCHSKFDFSPRSELKGADWERVFELENILKKQYK